MYTIYNQNPEQLVFFGLVVLHSPKQSLAAAVLPTLSF